MKITPRRLFVFFGYPKGTKARGMNLDLHHPSYSEASNTPPQNTMPQGTAPSHDVRQHSRMACSDFDTNVEQSERQRRPVRAKNCVFFPKLSAPRQLVSASTIDVEIDPVTRISANRRTVFWTANILRNKRDETGPRSDDQNLRGRAEPDELAHRLPDGHY